MSEGHPHIGCSAERCAWGGDEGFEEVDLGGRKVRFHGCPAKHLTGFDIGRWLSAYRWLNRWNVTPQAWGIPPERIDPRFGEAIELIDNEIARQREKEREAR